MKTLRELLKEVQAAVRNARALSCPLCPRDLSHDKTGVPSCCSRAVAVSVRPGLLAPEQRRRGRPWDGCGGAHSAVLGRGGARVAPAPARGAPGEGSPDFTHTCGARLF